MGPRSASPVVRGRRRWPAAAVGVIVLAGGTVYAHKPVTSKYTYNEHVFPILRDRCGRCHVSGGAAPMSLMTYRDAVPWAESIREELERQMMPPWYNEPSGPAVTGAHAISALEIDELITWASGGTPEGDPGRRPEPVASHPAWTAGPPDLSVPMPVPHTVGAGAVQESCTFAIATGLAKPHWIRGADLLPGEPSMVRDATISVEHGPVLRVWVPGSDAIGPPKGTGFLLPASATLRLDIHYKKSWRDEQKALTDRSTVGLYFTDDSTNPREIQSTVVDRPGADGRTVTGPALADDMTVVAVWPSLDQPYASVDVRAVAPDGKRVPLLRLHSARPEWQRRYWLASPVAVPKGSTLEVTLTPQVPDPDDSPTRPGPPFRVAVDFVLR